MLAYLQIADPNQRRRLLDLAEVYANGSAAVPATDVAQDNLKPNPTAVVETREHIVKLVHSESDGTP